MINRLISKCFLVSILYELLKLSPNYLHISCYTDLKSAKYFESTSYFSR